MKAKKVTNSSVETNVTSKDGVNNIWVEPMFNLANPKIQNDPKFKELSAGAKAFAALILETTPPGEGQRIALEKLSESYHHAGAGFVRNAASRAL